MVLNVLSLFPEIIHSYLSRGIINKALEKKIIHVSVINPRDFAKDLRKTVDDRPYGGGDGMVLMAEPFQKALESVKEKGSVCYLTPQGRRWTDKKARRWAKDKKALTLISGRYSGIDERFIHKYVDDEISVGDYVLSGGELGCLMVMDSLTRFLPEVLGNPESSLKESFSESLLEGPSFTRPFEFEGMKVPSCFLKGDHAEIEKIRKNIAILKTFVKRGDLLEEKYGRKEAFEAAKFLEEKLSLEELELCGLKPPLARDL